MSSPCSLCSAECCKTYVVTITSFDVFRICRETKRKHQDFAVLHEPRLLGFDPDLILNTTDGYERYLLGFKSHPCIFLGKDNLCKVHDSAPLSCRYYPYRLGRKMNARFCPLLPQLLFRIKGPDIREDSLLKEFKAYKKIVAEWNRNPGKREDCISFLLRKTEELHENL